MNTEYDFSEIACAIDRLTEQVRRLTEVMRKSKDKGYFA